VMPIHGKIRKQAMAISSGNAVSVLKLGSNERTARPTRAIA